MIFKNVENFINLNIYDLTLNLDKFKKYSYIQNLNGHKIMEKKVNKCDFLSLGNLKESFFFLRVKNSLY